MVSLWYLHRRENDGTSKFYPMHFPMTKSTYINFFLISLAILRFLCTFAFGIHKNKNMIRILDYIFYRTYIAYMKRNDPAGFVSPLYLGICLFFSFLPLFAIFGDMVRGDNVLYNNSFIGIYILGIFLFVYIRYSRKYKIRELIGEFSNCSLNRAIPTWCFFCVYPISIVLGVTGLILVTKYIIRPCGLTGIWYPFFANLFGN